MTRFRPGIAPTLVVLALLPLLVFLGFWQLARGEQKRVLLDSYAQRQAAVPVTAGQLLSTDEPAFRRVQLRGHFDGQHSLLLDNRVRDGKVGVELLQPFQDQASGQWLLLNRGWLPWPSRLAPPLALVLAGSKSSSLAQAMTTEAKASLISTGQCPACPCRLFSVRHKWRQSVP